MGTIAITTRRDFLNGGATAALGLVAGSATAGAGAGADGAVRFLAFADIHYATSGLWPHAERKWLDRVLDRAVSSKVDFVMSLGDFTFGPVSKEERDYVSYYNNFKPVKTYHTYGNHDYQFVAPEVLDELYGLKSGWYSFDLGGFRFVVLDPHYIFKDGKYSRFHSRCSYPELAKQGVPTFVIPPEQMEWLRKTVVGSPLPCVVFSHESIERGRSGIYNRAEVRAIFAEANAQRPGTVRLAINGHEHKDYFRMLDGVAYLDLNSASYDIGATHDAYPEDFLPKRKNSKYGIITWNDPISAVVTLTPSGGLKIEGMESTYCFGVSPETVGWGCDGDGRATSAKVQSVDINVNYARAEVK